MNKKNKTAKSLIILSAIPTFFLFQNLAFANNNNVIEYFKFFKNSQYEEAILALGKKENSDKSEGTYDYLLGLAYSRSQKYDLAVTAFSQAINAKNESKDLYYEYGQALYAINDLKVSREAFKKSAANNFNRNTSLYYIGHISQIIEEFPEAIKSYLEIFKDKKVDTKIDQIAKFQMAESILSLMRTSDLDKEKQEIEVDKRVLNLLKKAQAVDPKSSVAIEIEKRIKEIQKEFNLDPDLMTNGRRISPKRLIAYFDLKTKFDDNVTNSNLENDIQQTHKESFFIESEADIKYEYIFKKRFITSPELRLNFNHYANRDDASVYQNDAMIFTGSVKNKFEHTIKQNPASLIFDIDYAKTYKDYLQVHSRKFYANTLTFSAGEQFTYFSYGDTTVKYKYKKYDAYDLTLSNHTNSFSIDQTAILNNNQLLIALLETDFTNNYNNKSANTDAYILRFDYLIPEIFPKYTLALSLSTTLTDTLTQMQTRGYETTLNPTIEISKEISDKLKMVFSVDHTKNKSKSDQYNYNKTVTNIEFKYNF
jgi:tetratricopeptide (TPR) repeat protein